MIAASPASELRPGFWTPYRTAGYPTELAEEFVQTFNAKIATIRRQATTDRARVGKELDQVDGRPAGVLHSMKDGAWTEAAQTRLNDLKASKKALTAKRQAAGAPLPKVRLRRNADGPPSGRRCFCCLAGAWGVRKLGGRVWLRGQDLNL
jgi:hypothetical protein